MKSPSGARKRKETGRVAAEEAAAALGRILRGLGPFALASKARLKTLSRLPEKALESGLKTLAARGEAAVFLAGRAKLYGSAAGLREALAAGADDGAEAARERIGAAYRELVAAQGGFRSVAIAALAERSGVAPAALRRHIREELAAGRAVLHRRSDLPRPEDQGCAIYLDAEPEPFHNVEFGDFAP